MRDRDKKIVFLQKKGDCPEINGNYDVVLSPDLYWIKKIEVPLKSAMAAKRVAPALFEGSLGRGDYEYKILKTPEGFAAVAYSRDEIRQAIENCGLDFNKLDRVGFAQSFLEGVSDCVKIDDFFSLANIDGIWTKFPRGCEGGGADLRELLKERTLKDFVRLKREKGPLKKEHLFAAAIFFLLLDTALGTRTYSLRTALETMELDLKSYLEQNSLPSAYMALKSVKKRVDKKVSALKRQKTILKALSDLAKGNVRLFGIRVGSDRAVIKADISDLKKIEGFLKRRSFKVEHKLSGKMAEIGFGYE